MRMFTTLCAIAVLVPATLGAQQRPAAVYETQMRAAARLDSHPPERARVVVADSARRARRRYAPLIGAIVGAFAGPFLTYEAFHDSDSGTFGQGAILVTGAIGAFLGLMVGLYVRDH
ncbi:MAG: hypothetical protein ACREL5_07325 [Gemmatimonadales bacterium]